MILFGNEEMTKYYHQNFQSYFKKTVSVDPSSFLTPLIQRLNPGSKILDVGCGSGRDLLWLKNHGFDAVGFEYSPGLAELAEKYSGCRVIQGDFMNYDFSDFSFDALIIIGAMVHISHEEFSGIFKKITSGICKGGHILITLKHGNGIKTDKDNRIFYLWQEKDLERIFYNKNCRITDFFKQASIITPEDIWLGYVLEYRH